jgi:hypothetical protein
MGGVDVVLGVQCLQSLGIVALDFQYIFVRVSSNGKEIELRGIQGKPSKVIRSNKILKNGYHGLIA